jgi:YgiT-type zinc finger domain-containing protein
MSKKRSKRKRYPKDWKQRATACKHNAGWICEQCGESHLTPKISKRTGQEYPMYLHAAHVGRYTANPKLKSLCPRCHGKLDWQERQRRAKVNVERLKHHMLLVAR